MGRVLSCQQQRAEDAPLSAVVFKFEREASGEKIAYLRLFAGSIQVREDVPVSRKSHGGETETHIDKVKKLHLFRAGKSIQCATVGAGEFCKVWGLTDVKIADVVGEWSDRVQELHFVTPQMEARIEATDPEQSHQLVQALTELAEEDPLIKVSQDTFHRETLSADFRRDTKRSARSDAAGTVWTGGTASQRQGLSASKSPVERGRH